MRVNFGEYFNEADELKAKAVPLDIWMGYVLLKSGERDEEISKAYWYTVNNVGKKIICASKGYSDGKTGTRMFVRNVVNCFEDDMKKYGWWDLFTVCKERVPEGIWLCEIVGYRIDNNGYVNQDVKVLRELSEDTLAGLTTDSFDNWRSSAWWLLMNCSGQFVAGNQLTIELLNRIPNVDALRSEFELLNKDSVQDLAVLALRMFINKQIMLQDIQRCLDIPTEFEKVVAEVTNAILNNRVNKTYGYEYPIFAGKLLVNVDSSFEVKSKVTEYIKRQLTYYNILVAEKSIESKQGVLNQVETALAYRKSLKDAEKAEKKSKRKKVC